MKRIKLIVLIIAVVPILSFRDSTFVTVSIVGDWGIYHTVYTENNKSVASTCTVCPRIVFKPDHSAKLTDGHGKVYRLKWLQNADTLTVQNENTVSQTILAESIYLVHITDTTEHYLEIELVLPHRGEKKILRKKI